MKIIRCIFAFPLSLLMLLGVSTFMYSATSFENQNNAIQIIDNTIGNAVQTPLCSLQYYPEIHFRPLFDAIFCPKYAPIEQYSDWPQTNLNSPLRAFKFALGQFTADY